MTNPINLQDLRDYIASQVENLPPWEFPLCLDPKARQVIDRATSVLIELEARKATPQIPGEPGKQRKSIASVATSLDADLEKARQTLTEAEEAAAGRMIVPKWRKLLPEQYDALSEAAVESIPLLKTGKIDLIGIDREIKRRLPYESFIGVFTVDGQQLEEFDTWESVIEKGFVSSTDADLIGQGLAGFNRASAHIPFDLATFGKTATN